MQRIPTKKDSLKTLMDYGVPVGSILDVGVLNQTDVLIDLFPDKIHQLFEPVDKFFEDIKHNYRDIKYNLHHVAVSDKDGQGWQANVSIDGSPNALHSYFSDKKITVEDDPKLVECKPVKVAKLDSIIDNKNSAPYLLKIDVDGQEMEVLKGADKTLKNTSILMIEAPLHKSLIPPIIERANYLLKKNFILYDIVDMAYYKGLLSQVDLIFINHNIVEEIKALRPGREKIFDFDKWYPLTDQCFK